MLFELIKNFLTKNTLDSQQRLFEEIKRYIIVKKKQNKLPPYLFEFNNIESVEQSEIDRLAGLVFTLFNNTKIWVKSTKTAFEYVISNLPEQLKKQKSDKQKSDKQKLNIDLMTANFLFYQKGAAIMIVLEDFWRGNKDSTKGRKILQCRDYITKLLKTSNSFKPIYTSAGALRYGLKEWKNDEYMDKSSYHIDFNRIHIENIENYITINPITGDIRINDYKLCIFEILKQADCPLASFNIATTLQRLVGMIVQELPIQLKKNDDNEDIASAEENVTADGEIHSRLVSPPEFYEKFSITALNQQNNIYYDFIKKHLSERELKILKLKNFEKLDDSCLVLDKDIAPYLRLSEERIRQIKKEVLNKIIEKFYPNEDIVNFMHFLAGYLKNYKIKGD